MAAFPQESDFDRALREQRSGRVVMETTARGDHQSINFDRRKFRALAKSLGKTSKRQLKKLRRSIRQVESVSNAVRAGAPNPLCGVVGCEIAERHQHVAARGGAA